MNSTPNQGYQLTSLSYPHISLARSPRLPSWGLPLPLTSPNSTSFYCPEKICTWLSHLLEFLLCLSQLYDNSWYSVPHGALPGTSGLSSTMGHGWCLQPPSQGPHVAVPQKCCGRSVLGIQPLYKPNLLQPSFHLHECTMANSCSIFLIQPQRHKMLIRAPSLDNIGLAIPFPMQGYSNFFRNPITSLELLYDFQTQKAE